MAIISFIQVCLIIWNAFIPTVDACRLDLTFDVDIGVLCSACYSQSDIMRRRTKQVARTVIILRACMKFKQMQLRKIANENCITFLASGPQMSIQSGSQPNNVYYAHTSNITTILLGIYLLLLNKTNLVLLIEVQLCTHSERNSDLGFLDIIITGLDSTATGFSPKLIQIQFSINHRCKSLSISTVK